MRSAQLSSNRSPGKHQTDKIRKGECDSRNNPSSLRKPPSPSGGPSSAEISRSNPYRISRQERSPTSNEMDGTKPDKARPKSSRPLEGDKAGQKSSIAVHKERVKSSHRSLRQRPSSDEKRSEAEQRGKPGRKSLHSDGEEGDAEEDADSKPASPKRKNEKKKTPSSAASRPTTLGPRWRSAYTDSHPQTYALQSDLRKGHNYYLYCLGRIYDVTEMRRQKELQYWNLLARQRQLGFHSPKECDVYTRYLSRPRTAEYGRIHSDSQRTKSTEGRRREGTDRRSRTADNKGRAVDDDRHQRDLCGDRESEAVSSKSRAMSSKQRPASSKPRPVSSKPRSVSSKSRLDSSKEDRRESADQKNASLDGAEDAELNRRQNETTDAESDTSQSDEETSKNSSNSQSGKDQRGRNSQGGKDQSGRNSQGGKDQEKAGSDQEPEVSRTSIATQIGKKDNQDSGESDGRGNIPAADDGYNKPVDVTAGDGSATKEASSDSASD